MADTENDSSSHPILPTPRRRRFLGQKQLKDRTRFRLLVACLITGLVATVFFLAAMATTDWVRLKYPTGLFRRSTSAYVEQQVSGLFRLCRFELDNSSSLHVVRRKLICIFYLGLFIYLSIIKQRTHCTQEPKN